ncbi:restriction endonuclease subunit S [Streptomyces noursei]|uniref:restriction endonuclease subunit S n=1 Tax=Streptomyces noursei TaxID=1971 RepID=UPI0033D4F255
MGGEAHRQVRLKEVLQGNLRNGYSPKEVPQWTGVLALGLGCLTGDGFVPRQLKRVPDTPEARRALLQEGDLLVSRANTRELVGLAGRYQDVGAPCIYPDLMMRLRVNASQCLPSYMELVLRSDAVRRELRALARGTSESMVKISAGAVENLVVPLPSLDGQRQIVAAHKAVEHRIAALERVQAKSSVAEAALSANALASGVDKWPIQRLESIATVAAGVTLGSEPTGDGVVELPYLRVANVLDGRIDTAEVKTVRILRSQYDRYALRPGDLLLTEGGDLDKLGRGAVWDGRLAPCLHQNHVFRVRCSDVLSSDFLELYTSSPAGRAYFQSVGKQTTNLASINSTQVKDMPVPVPPPEEQDRLLAPVRAIRARIAALSSQIEKLKAVQKGMTEDLLTGRMRLEAVPRLLPRPRPSLSLSDSADRLRPRP